MLQKYFEHFGEKYWFKVRLERATTIQKNRRSDSIVTNFYFTSLLGDFCNTIPWTADMCEPWRHFRVVPIPDTSKVQRSGSKSGQFAERALRNICSGSLRLDARELDHLGPLIGFLGDMLGELHG